MSENMEAVTETAKEQVNQGGVGEAIGAVGEAVGNVFLIVGEVLGALGDL